MSFIVIFRKLTKGTELMCCSVLIRHRHVPKVGIDDNETSGSTFHHPPIHPTPINNSYSVFLVNQL